MAKTRNAFEKHVSELKQQSGFTGVVTHLDNEYLFKLYMLCTLAVFKEETLKFFHRKREEN